MVSVLKAVVYHGKEDVRVEDVKKPDIMDSRDVIVKVTKAAICGSDLHFYHGKTPDYPEGRIIGHEFVGTVEKTGDKVKNLKEGDRVAVPSNIAEGHCDYCQKKEYTMCSVTFPYSRDHSAQPALFGGADSQGGYDGGQAEYVRIPYGDVMAVAVPDGVNDEQAVSTTDIFPTGYFAVEEADVEPEESVAIFGAGPVGQMSALCAKLKGAGEVFVIDSIPERLAMARQQGARVIDYRLQNPLDVLWDDTDNEGTDVAIEAAGFEAHCAAACTSNAVCERASGECPDQALNWAIEAAKKGGHVAVMGVFGRSLPINSFMIGEAFAKGLTLHTGHCPQLRYIPDLLDMIQRGEADPSFMITDRARLEDAAEMYRRFSERKGGCVKVVLDCT